MLKSIKPKGWVVAAYLAVPVALYVFTVFAPLLAALFYSFLNGRAVRLKLLTALQIMRSCLATRFSGAPSGIIFFW